jgi:membrane-associated phospholipid phosphatase
MHGEQRRSVRQRANVACPLLALLAVAASAGVALVAEDLTAGGRFVVWDGQVRARFPLPSPSALTTFFRGVTWAGNAFVLVALVTVAAIWFLRRREPARAGLVVVGVFAAEAIALTLKVSLHDLHPNSYAFPSGHTAGASATYGILFYFAARSRALSVRVVAVLAFLALVTLVGFSRLYLHVHYLSDVLAGTALGVAVAAVCLCTYELRHARHAPA